MKTEDLIAQLARDARPVRRVRTPPARLAQWMAAALPLAALGILLVGPRADLKTVLHSPGYLAVASITLLTAVLAAASSLVLSVPGAAQTPVPRALPVVAWSAWVVGLMALLVRGGDAIERLASLPIHVACVIEIGVFGLLPGWVLVSMLRRAAPLDLTWSAGLAAVAATALGAFATQMVCPIDDAAHHLAGHVLPMVLFAILGTRLVRPSLDWLSRRRAQ